MKVAKSERLVGLGLGLMVAVSLTTASHAQEEEIEWDTAELFFELNDTDGDLGLQADLDGEPWESLTISDPRDIPLLNLRTSTRLRRQGLSELTFESNEPPFDEVPPEITFRRFPEGVYEIEALTLEGQELESEVMVSHVLAGPPSEVTVNGQPSAADCDADVLPVVMAPVTIDWAPVIESHPTIGTTGVPVEIDVYQFFLERDDAELGVDLANDVTEFTAPAELLGEPGEWKFEIIAREENGNKTAVESCFFLQ
ncbi:MAG: hypothetical protein AAF184_18395 [Pseudomonadota bacterium]